MTPLWFWNDPPTSTLWWFGSDQYPRWRRFVLPSDYGKPLAVWTADGVTVKDGDVISLEGFTLKFE